MRISSCIQVAANGIISFFFTAAYYTIVHMYHFLIHSSVNGLLGCFQVLAIVNSAAMNIEVHVSFFSAHLEQEQVAERQTQLSNKILKSHCLFFFFFFFFFLRKALTALGWMNEETGLLVLVLCHAACHPGQTSPGIVYSR